MTAVDVGVEAAEVCGWTSASVGGENRSSSEVPKAVVVKVASLDSDAMVIAEWLFSASNRRRRSAIGDIVSSVFSCSWCSFSCQLHCNVGFPERTPLRR